MSFATLSPDEERELHRLSRYYWEEAKRCEQAKAYLAGCAMIASALEAMLLLMVNAFDEEAAATGAAPTRKNAIKPLVDWTLADLIRVAKAAGWLPHGLEAGVPWNSRKARIGDFAEVMRMVRNLVHPARYAQDHAKSRVTAKYLQRQFDVALLCRDWLLARNNRSLRARMKEHGLL